MQEEIDIYDEIEVKCFLNWLNIGTEEVKKYLLRGIIGGKY